MRQGRFRLPTEPATWTVSPSPHPAVAALLMPNSGVGGLETLCLAQLRPRHPKVATCLDAYLACIPPLNRSREKHDKAGSACLIAAIERRDPTMTITRAFSATTAPRCRRPTFAPFSDALASLLADLPASGPTPSEHIGRDLLRRRPPSPALRAQLPAGRQDVAAARGAHRRGKPRVHHDLRRSGRSRRVLVS